METLLIGGGLAATSLLLNSKPGESSTPTKTMDVYDQGIGDTRVVENKLIGDLQKDGTNVESTREIRSLTGDTIKSDEFVHNNMTPFFRGGGTNQDMRSESSSVFLERFTGVHDTPHKNEISPLFQTSKDDIYGTHTNRLNAFQDRYVPSYKNQGVPVKQPVHVGPGLKKYTNEPHGGGFQNFDNLEAIRPKTVDDLRNKLNPKETYEGRIIQGKKAILRDATPNIAQNRPVRFHAINGTRNNTTVVQSGATLRENFEDKVTNRQGTLTSHVPNPGSHITHHRAKDYEVNLNVSRQELEQFGPRNLSNRQRKPRVHICEHTVHDNEQENTFIGHAKNTINKLIAPVQDILKPTIKETNIHDTRQYGNISHFNKQTTVHDDNDTARTTLKETLLHDSTSNGIMTPLLQQGIVQNNEPAKTTARETLKHYIESTNPKPPHIRPSRQEMSEIPSTMRDVTGEDNYKGNIKVRKDMGYLTNKVEAPETTRQDNYTSYSGISHGDELGAYVHTDIKVKDTMRVHEDYVGTGKNTEALKPKSYADIYNATLNDVREDTLKERAPTPSSTKIQQLSVGEVSAKEPLEHTLYLQPTRNQEIVDKTFVDLTTEKCQQEENRFFEPDLHAQNLKENEYVTSILRK